MMKYKIQLLLLCLFFCANIQAQQLESKMMLVFKTETSLLQKLISERDKHTVFARARDTGNIFYWKNGKWNLKRCVLLRNTAPTSNDLEAEGCIWINQSDDSIYFSTQKGSENGDAVEVNNSQNTNSFTAVSTTKRHQTFQLSENATIEKIAFLGENSTGVARDYVLAIEDNTGTTLQSQVVSIAPQSLQLHELVLNPNLSVTANTEYRISIVRDVNNTAGTFNWHGYTENSYDLGTFSNTNFLADAAFQIQYSSQGKGNVWLQLGQTQGDSYISDVTVNNDQITFAGVGNAPSTTIVTERFFLPDNGSVESTNTNTGTKLKRNGAIGVNLSNSAFPSIPNTSFYGYRENSSNPLFIAETNSIGSAYVQTKSGINMHNFGTASNGDFYLFDAVTGRTGLRIKQGLNTNAITILQDGKIRLNGYATTQSNPQRPSVLLSLNSTLDVLTQRQGELPDDYLVIEQNATNNNGIYQPDNYVNLYVNARLNSVSANDINIYLNHQATGRSQGDFIVVHAMDGSDNFNVVVHAGNQSTPFNGLAGNFTENQNPLQSVTLKDGDVLRATWRGTVWIYQIARVSSDGDGNGFATPANSGQLAASTFNIGITDNLRFGQSLMYLDETNNYVGINELNPDFPLDVNGTVNVDVGDINIDVNKSIVSNNFSLLRLDSTNSVLNTKIRSPDDLHLTTNNDSKVIIGVNGEDDQDASLNSVAFAISPNRNFSTVSYSVTRGGVVTMADGTESFHGATVGQIDNFDEYSISVFGKNEIAIDAESSEHKYFKGGEAIEDIYVSTTGGSGDFTIALKALRNNGVAETIWSDNVSANGNPVAFEATAAGSFTTATISPFSRLYVEITGTSAGSTVTGTQLVYRVTN